MNTRIKNTIRILASLSVSIAAILFIAWTVDWSELRKSLETFESAFLIPAAVIYASTFIFRAIRWQIFLKGLRNVSFVLSLEVIILGWAANNLLPARLGELVRAYAMGARAHISRTASLATILVERVFDGAILLMSLLFLFVIIDFPDWVTNLAWVGILLFGGISALLVLLRKYRNTLGTASTFILHGISPRLDRMALTFLQKFAAGLNILTHPAGQFMIILLTAVIWALEAGTYALVLNGFHMSVPVEGIVFSLVIVNMGILIPSSPGYIGTFQFFAILALSVFGISPESALSFAIILHALQYIPVTLTGLVIMNRMGFSFRELRHAK